MSNLLDQVSEKIKLLHYSIRTDKAYGQWIKQFILYQNKTHPEKLGQSHIKAFLSYLTNERNVSASTQNIAKNAVLFLYKHVLEIDIGNPAEYVIVKRSKRIPTVFS